MIIIDRDRLKIILLKSVWAFGLFVFKIGGIS